MRGSKNLMVAEISQILSIHGPCIQSSKNLMVVEISYNRANIILANPFVFVLVTRRV